MKENLLKKVFHTMTEAFRNCLKRFPVTVGFILAFTGYLVYLVATDADNDKKLLLVWGYYLSIGTLLSLSLHLWSEEIKSNVRKVIIHVAAHALLIADAWFLYSLSLDQRHIEIGIAHVAGVFALGISIFFLSFTKEKNDIPSWNFTSTALGACIIANVIGYIMSGGISLLTFSLHMLFDVKVDNKCYLYILIICSVLLPMLLFIGLLPKDAQKHNHQPHSSDFQSGIIHFLFLPLIAGYLLVLYIYTARILTSWELPIGWVSWLVVTLMAGCIAIEFGLYSTRIKEAKRGDEWVARWLPALVLPLLMLMTVGIIRRLNDYGITINRLYLITLNVWFYIVCIGLILTKARRISWIPISFAIIFLLTSVLPVNYASITRNAIRSNLEMELRNTCDMELPLSRQEYNDWLASLPKETAMEVNDKFLYLSDWLGQESIADWVEKDVSFYTAKYHYERITDSGAFISYDGQTHHQTSIEIPKGYNHLGILSKTYSIPHKYVETGILPVPLDYQTGDESDTLYLDLKTLKELGESRYGEMTPTRFKCSSKKALFVLSNFSVTYYEAGDEDITLSINGYLFMK